MGMTCAHTCTSDPIGAVAARTDNQPMVYIAIRCHPSVPVDAEDLEEWLEHQVEKLRAKAPNATIRLARLSQQLPNAAVDVGWLLELELEEVDRAQAEQQLDESLTDMRLLGFQPTLLRTSDASRLAGSGRYASAWD
jgi:hypothetical protein